MNCNYFIFLTISYLTRLIKNINTINETNLSKDKQIDTLFHMATGSGKTVIMASLILYLCTQRYRNFVFVVNQNNIIQKTKETFQKHAAILILLSV
ncbi:DEAD/DEAH box helicase family protein [Carnobacterium sp. PL12RED10]|nr:DEAD/DEAH box helicase family protein [Carnobacterium sp. PL12RED10]